MSETHTVGVTGSGGYIGSRVVADLQADGHGVVPIDNFSNAQVERINGRQIRNVDVRDRAVLEETLENVDAIAHLAAVSGVPDCTRDPERAFVVNVGGTANVAWLCHKRRIPLVFAGSVAALGPPTEFPITADHPRKPTNFYGRTKAMSEDDVSRLAADAFPAHVLLHSNLYGDHHMGGTRVHKDVVTTTFIERALAEKPLEVHTPGTQTFNFVHVNDAAKAHVRSINTLLGTDSGAKTIVLGSSECLNVRELAKLVQKIAREERGIEATIKYVENPRGDDAIEAEDFTVDTSEAAEAIGFTPECDIETGIREMMRQKEPARS